MGLNFIDNYSLLHFAVGIIANFWNIKLIHLIIIHIIFEYVENTLQGINFINKNIKLWPGGKFFADSIINRTGDVLSSVIGWMLADYINKKYI